jgi:hypothetical protein
MGKQRTAALTIITVLLCSVLAITHLAVLIEANPLVPKYLPEIKIKNDGNIEPETEYISKAGKVYTLTANLSEKYSIVIECSSIVFDGAGYKIDCSGGGYRNVGLKLVEVTNVTVKNLGAFTVNPSSIWLYNCSDCEILKVKTNKDVTLAYSDFNTITESQVSIGLDASSNNTITRNNITELHIAGYEGLEYECNSNSFFKNNIFSNISLEVKEGVTSYLVNSANFWDNGSEGNYWSNYEGTDNNNDGIGDTSYTIDENNQDNYPLVEPIEIPEFPPWTILPLLLIATSATIIYKKRLPKQRRANA